MARGLVTRAGDSTDRRTVALDLADDGREAVRRWHVHNAEILHAALGRLHPAWQYLLTAALPALHELVGAIDELADTAPASPSVRHDL